MNDSEQERRKSSRYTPARTEVWIGWEGPHGFQSVRVQALNISHGGIALLDVVPLPESAPLWVKLFDADEVPWAPVTLAGRGAHETGNAVVRLQFLDDCPYDFYRTAVFGFSGPAGISTPPPSEVKAPERPEEPDAPPLPVAPPASPGPAVAVAEPGVAAAVPIGIATPIEHEPEAAERERLRDAFTRQRRFFRGG